MKILKKNQVVIYTLALMLMTAGYLNYTSKIKNKTLETASDYKIEENIENSNKENENDDNENKEENETKNEDRVTNEGKEDELTQNNDESCEKNEDSNKCNTSDGNNNEKNNDENKEESEKNEEKHNSEELNLEEDKNKVADIGDATLVSSNDVVTDYYVKTKLERDSMYSQMLETYEKVLNSTNAQETQKKIATQEITKINQTKNSIMICENLIKTKGFENCVVLVNDKSVSVIVGCKELKKEQTAQIQNIISRELNAKIEDIHISTK